MAIVKVIEVLAESEESWEDAARTAIAEAGKTVHGIRSLYIKEFQATVEGEEIRSFRINGKISFVIEREAAGAAQSGAGRRAAASRTARSSRSAGRERGGGRSGR